MLITRRIGAAALTAAVVCTGCATSDPKPVASAPARSAAVGGSATGSEMTDPSPSGTDSIAPQIPVASQRPLAGKIVGIDPGHDGGNFNDPGYINTLVWNGRSEEACDTTGTATASGYTEAEFNFNVASDLRANLIADGARVVMTRTSNHGVGPCVTMRAQIINHAHANVAIDIHADGGPASGRGFTVLEPVADGTNDEVISPSVAFGSDVRAAMLADTTMPASNYYGTAGVVRRDDLAGLNLTTVPKILIECGNMPNPADARLLTSGAFQAQIARALTAAIVAFLTGRSIRKG